MTPDANEEDKIRKAYSDLRLRLIGERDRELTRIAASRDVLRRIDEDLATLEREQRMLEGGG